MESRSGESRLLVVSGLVSSSVAHTASGVLECGSSATLLDSTALARHSTHPCTLLKLKNFYVAVIS